MFVVVILRHTLDGQPQRHDGHEVVSFIAELPYWYVYCVQSDEEEVLKYVFFFACALFLLRSVVLVNAMQLRVLRASVVGQKKSLIYNQSNPKQAQA